MATYKEIQGEAVINTSSDITSGEGQVYYNTTGNTFSLAVATPSTGVWSTGGNLTTARYQLGGAGTQTAGLGFGGNPPIPGSNATEEYDGTSWTSGNNMNTARRLITVGSGFGTQTAGLAVNGLVSSKSSAVEEYDGTSWSEVNSTNTTRYSAGISGIQTNAIYFGGDTNPPPGGSAATEAYDGTTFSATSNLGTARQALSGSGTASAALACAGYIPPNTQTLTEEFNKSAVVTTGAAWASSGNMNTARGYVAGFGLQTAAVAAAGYNGTARTSNVEEYNGSTWTNATALPSTFAYGSGAGIETAGLYFGGTVPGSPAFAATTLEYDGSSWSSANSMSTGRYNIGSAGIQTAGLAAGGVPGSGSPSYTKATEHYDGTNWTAGGNMNTFSSGMGGAGTLTAGIMFGRGAIPSDQDKNIEEYNGSAWTTSPATMQVCEELSASSQNAPSSDSIIFGNHSATVTTEQWNGTVSVTTASLGTARRATGGAGTGSSGLAFGGSPSSPSPIATTEEFTAETTSISSSTLTTS